MTTPVANASANTSASTNSAVSSGQINLTSDYNTFLKLLTTQLKNQDPLSPMDTNNFTQQLVMMNGVQQQLQSNALLQTLVNQGSGSGPAVNLIGKQVTVASDTATMANGTIPWSYNLGSDAAAATLNVLDSAGKVVWSQAAPSLTKGEHAFTWDGTTLTGGKVTAGDYSLNVTANDASLKTVASGVTIQGVVTGVQSSSTGTQLNLGKTVVDYTKITKVQNPTVASTSTTQ
jgi:flagellar basal-body rod modification protein FlgD